MKGSIDWLKLNKHQAWHAIKGWLMNLSGLNKLHQVRCMAPGGEFDWSIKIKNCAARSKTWQTEKGVVDWSTLNKQRTFVSWKIEEKDWLIDWLMDSTCRIEPGEAKDTLPSGTTAQQPEQSHL